MPVTQPIVEAGGFVYASTLGRLYHKREYFGLIPCYRPWKH